MGSHADPNPSDGQRRWCAIVSTTILLSLRVIFYTQWEERLAEPEKLGNRRASTEEWGFGSGIYVGTASRSAASIRAGDGSMRVCVAMAHEDYRL